MNEDHNDGRLATDAVGARPPQVVAPHAQVQSFYAVVVRVLRVGRRRDEAQQMTHCVGSTRRGRGEARARVVVGLPFERAKA